MKQIKDTEGNIIEVIEGSTIDPFHAYISLMLSMLKEPFMSSDLKFLIIKGSFSRLEEMGYSEEQIDIYKEKLKKVVELNIEVNSFMG